ncbi:MAG: beta-lactamase family protein [Candidatus Hydrogenedentes bacterium]|nr:beta-lactamase family protein [Candidatus Hydrogenedentota bacterium]
MLPLLIAVTVPAQEAPDWGAIDAFFAKEMEARHIPGAVFAAVQGQDIVYKKGYGLAQVENQTAVDPDQTLFRVASLSKLFVATAVMQLVEVGKLDVNADVNQYLGEWKIEDAGFGPLTLQDLLTHTPGLDDRYLGMSVLTPYERLTLEEALQQVKPPRILPPGRALMYSNYAYSLAGYIVERVSGMPYSDYVDAHILKPLGMDKSGYKLQEAATENLAQGYVYRFGELATMPYDYQNHYPAGAMMVTGGNMAHFAIAHLNGGRFGEVVLLKPETTARMHERHFSHAPELDGWCYGFEEEHYRGLRLLTHGGSTSGFTSQIVLVPEKNAGYFFSCNHEATDGTAIGIQQPLRTEYFDTVLHQPEPAPETKPAGGAFDHDPALAGVYRNMRYERHTLSRVAALIDGQRATLLEDGSLRFGSRTFVPMASNLFGRAEGGDRAAFLPATAATPAMIAVNSNAFQKVPAWDAPLAQQGFLLLSLLLLLVPQLVALFSRSRKGVQSAGDRDMRFGWRLLAFVSLLHLVFLGVVGGYLLTMVRYTMFWGPPSFVIAALALPLVALVFTGGGLGWAVKLWRGQTGSKSERSLYLLAHLGAVGMLVFLQHWNLLGYHTG